MKKLHTPIYYKTDDDMPWPADPVFFLMAANGLFLCRNHEFFKSAAKAPNFPSELKDQTASLKLNYPKVPRRIFELAVGFFARIYALHQSEAGLLLYWNPTKKRMRLVCPKQLATVSKSYYGGVHPIGLHFDYPDPGDDIILGDMHSHADEPAYASWVDKNDEASSAGGIHLVVGRCCDVLNGKLPDVHVEIVVDGQRFKAAPSQLIEGYNKPRMNVPQEWIDSLTVDSHAWKKSSSWSSDDKDSKWGEADLNKNSTFENYDKDSKDEK